MPFKEGKAKTGGRKKGTPNKITQTTREMISDIVDGQLQTLMNEINELEPKERADFVVKLLPYVIPKLNSTDPQEKISSEKSFLQEISDKIIFKKDRD